jgi:uncharacterized membrane protein
MNKTRLEALSDGVFSIVMTLLVFAVSVPVLGANPSNAQVLTVLQTLLPLFATYFVSFVVLTMFWVSHSFFYSSFTNVINRKLVLLNMFYLAFVALVPFSARLLGEYATNQVAALVYGLNVLVIGLVSSSVLHYAIYSDEIDTSHISPRLLKQARVRSLLTPMCTFLGVVCVFVSLPAALLLFAFPIVFNMVPGTLDFVERTLGLKF